MGTLRIPIDLKSLYFNIKNDNLTGHTATVATPLKQGEAERPELGLLNFIEENVSSESKENIVSQLLSKSRAEARINKVFVFDRVSVNGFIIKDTPSFCMYIREETDSKNVHCGREKMHYPISFSYSDLENEIDNKKVLLAVSKYLKDYAFIVEAFEYSPEERILNFDVTVVGPNSIPYSKVFLNRRGVGNKFSGLCSIGYDNYDMEIIALRDKLGYSEVNPDNYYEVIDRNIEIARDIAVDYLMENGMEKIRVLKRMYPYSLYDIEYYYAGSKHYCIVRQTATKKRYFSLQMDTIQFIHDFSEFTSVILVTDINGKPKASYFSADEINKMQKKIESVRFEDRR